MNRAERRRQGRTKDPTYTLTQSQIDMIKQEATNEALEQALLLLLGLPVMVLHDKYSLLMKREVDGASREERFTELLLDLYDSFERGYITLDDVKDVLQEECGISVVEERVKTHYTKKDI